MGRTLYGNFVKSSVHKDIQWRRRLFPEQPFEDGGGLHRKARARRRKNCPNPQKYVSKNLLHPYQDRTPSQKARTWPREDGSLMACRAEHYRPPGEAPQLSRQSCSHQLPARQDTAGGICSPGDLPPGQQEYLYSVSGWEYLRWPGNMLEVPRRSKTALDGAQ